MHENSASDLTPEIPLAETLQLLTGGYFLARCLHVVADLGVADALGEQPASASTLAETTGAHPGALARVLNLLCTHGIFATRGDGYVQNAASQLLRSDHPYSMRSFVRMFGLPLFWSSAKNLDKAVQTGQPVLSDVAPKGFWGYFAENPEVGRIFNEAMAAKAQAVVPGVLASYDFSQFRLIGDIGGVAVICSGRFWPPFSGQRECSWICRMS